MNHIEISFLTIPEVEWQDRGQKYCLKVLDHLEKDNCEISLVFTDDDNIAELNGEYRDKEGPTDVLTFCQDEGEPFPVGEEDPFQYLGDIVVSLDTVKRHSMEFHVTFDEELRRVLVHAILHLLGWTHKTREPKDPMLQYQETIIKTIGESIL